MRRLAILGANAALFVFCCFLAGRMLSSVLAETIAPARATVGAAPASVSSVARAWADRESILDRNLFAAKLNSDEVVEEVVVVVEDDLDETKLPLRLLGTVAADDPDVARAAIEDTGTRKHQVVWVGDTLTNHEKVEVVRIERRRVVLQNGPKREELGFNAIPQPPPPQAARGRRGRAAVARRTPRRPPNTVAARLQELQQPPAAQADGRSSAELFSQARIVPKYDEGQMVGVQLNGVKAGSLYEKIGIASGDVITSLNGIAIDGPAASARVLTEFTSADEFSLTLGDGREINVSAEELAELTGEDS